MNILNQKVSNKMIIIIISILIVIAISASTTYSLISGSKKLSNNSYSTGILDITYNEGETLVLNSYIPMDDIQGSSTKPYTITISNKGTVSYKFDLSILSTVEDVNNIINPKYIKIQVDEKEPVKLSDLNNGLLYTGLIIDSGKDIQLKIRMWLDEKTPNTEIGHIYSAKLVASGLAVINENTLHTTSLGYQTLVKLKLENNAILKNEDGIIETENNNLYEYFFKGSINYNYVLLNNIYYRIIKIDEKGNIKIIYSGTKAYNNNYDDSKTKDTIIEESKFNENNTSDLSVGYTYLDDTNTQNLDSIIKEKIELWYEENIKETDIENKIVDTVYCNEKNSESIVTSCSPDKSYTVSPENGNGLLKYKVGLISLRELEQVGTGYINNNIPFWTMTPAKGINNEHYMYSFDNTITQNKVDDTLGIKPVLTITADGLKGEGTINNPFTY